jgi:hypothetical protein
MNENAVSEVKNSFLPGQIIEFTSECNEKAGNSASDVPPFSLKSTVFFSMQIYFHFQVATSVRIEPGTTQTNASR